MKIKKFRIKNYKSIIDSGDCYLEQDLTIFAGKNESGKTSVLEALENFNTNSIIPENAKPISKGGELPEIILTLVLTADEINSFFDLANIQKKNKTEHELVITKQFPNSYLIDPTTAKLFELEENIKHIANQELVNKINEAYQVISEIHAQYFARYNLALFVLNLRDIPTLTKQVEEYLRKYRTSFITKINNHQSKAIILSKIKELLTYLPEIHNTININNSRWEVFSKIIPNFILFKSFEDTIPNEVPFSELENNEFIKDLKIISDINIPLIKSDDNRTKLQHNKEVNINFNKEYSQFWLQDLTEIQIHWDNNSLQFWIEENSIHFKPSERSKGKQWHMSFYIKITARATEQKINVLLIDEPGLYLHATAQKDIYKKLINRSEKSQILFTTHSPYLINRDELHRIRLVLKGISTKKNGTIIENKLHANADKETLTPILTAIGLGMNDGIQNINQEKNVVIEGPSDYFYMQGLKMLLENSSFNFIFGGGSGNMGKIGSILTGWGCKVIYLYDNDQGMKDGSKNLKKVWHVNETLILSVKEGAGTIEDIFSKDDFLKLVLQDEIKIEASNSDYLKKSNLNKVLLAKLFNSRCHTDKIKLTAETLKNCKNIFDKLDAAFDRLLDNEGV